MRLRLLVYACASPCRSSRTGIKLIQAPSVTHLMFLAVLIYLQDCFSCHHTRPFLCKSSEGLSTPQYVFGRLLTRNRFTSPKSPKQYALQLYGRSIFSERLKSDKVKKNEGTKKYPNPKKLDKKLSGFWSFFSLPQLICWQLGSPD